MQAAAAAASERASERGGSGSGGRFPQCSGGGGSSSSSSSDGSRVSGGHGVGGGGVVVVVVVAGGGGRGLRSSEAGELSGQRAGGVVGGWAGRPARTGRASEQAWHGRAAERGRQRRRRRSPRPAGPGLQQPLSRAASPPATPVLPRQPAGPALWAQHPQNRQRPGAVVTCVSFMTPAAPLFPSTASRDPASVVATVLPPPPGQVRFDNSSISLYAIGEPPLPECSVSELQCYESSHIIEEEARRRKLMANAAIVFIRLLSSGKNVGAGRG
ncbi:Hypothetical predicted protein [Podarcis lilfordi]|uniref:Uncharacterized protein n=1 Tax=Podarcis lilfordi TaxID=74358 RepID=A0AA35JXB9_9SAUR|nr:Hypothetical predicted protein [Podarcis lilfordi]